MSNGTTTADGEYQRCQRVKMYEAVLLLFEAWAKNGLDHEFTSRAMNTLFETIPPEERYKIMRRLFPGKRGEGKGE